MSTAHDLSVAVGRAESLAARDDLVGARTALKPAIEAAVPALGDDHPEVVAANRALAAIHRRLGDLPGARRLLEETLVAGAHRLGEDHPVLLSISYDLAILADELGNRHEARRNFGMLARLGPEVLGPDHEYVRAAVRYLGGGGGTAQSRHPWRSPPTREVDGEPPAAESPAAQSRAVAPPGPWDVPPPPAGTAGSDRGPRIVWPPEPAGTRPSTADDIGSADPILDDWLAGLHEPGIRQPRPDRFGQAEPFPRERLPDTEPFPRERLPEAEPFARDRPAVGEQPARPVEPGIAFGGHEIIHHAAEGHARAPLILLVLITTLALIGGAVAAVVAFRGTAHGPPSGSDSSTTAEALPPPGDLRLRDNGASITLTWTDPSNGSVPFVVAGGRADKPPGPLQSIGSGQTSYTINGLNPAVDYCFLVAAVYAAGQTMPSTLVCTQRARSLSPAAS